jgi:hypothetical protein
VKKTLSAQAQDHACIFRVMRGNSRITLTVRTGGAVNLRIYSADGSVQRSLETTVIPELLDVFLIGFSWDGTTASLCVYNWTKHQLVESVSSSTNLTTLPSWTEADGLYIGNRADLSLPYNGGIYGGSFGMDHAYSCCEMVHEFEQGNAGIGRDFLMHPRVMARWGDSEIRESHNLALSVTTPSLDVFWSNDSDLIGAGPIASAPDAGLYPVGVLWYDDETGEKWQVNQAGNFVNNESLPLADKVFCEHAFDPNQDFSLTIIFKQVLNTVEYTGLFCQSVDPTNPATSNRALWLESTADSGAYLLKAYYGSLSHALGSIPSIIDEEWHKLVIKRENDEFVCVLDGIALFNVPALYTYNVPNYTTIGSQIGGRTIQGQLQCVKVDGSKPFMYDFNQPASTTIIDKSGNGNNATLTDGSPTTFCGNKYWVPLSKKC